MAFKHGALVANPQDVTLMRDRHDVISRMGVWARRTKRVDWGGHHSVAHAAMAQHVLGVGGLALDVLDYLVATRLEIFDFLRIEDDGTVTPLPINAIPWQFWMRPSDVGEANLHRLRERLGVELLSVPATAEIPNSPEDLPP